jgi:NAD(P)-dependent dehydrogenase (short-subunit alcohol dehydrogenase family)
MTALESDVTDESSVQQYVKAATDSYGRIDVFFNNAGIKGIVSPIPEYPLEEFQKVLAVNVVGVFLGLKHVIPIMAAGRWQHYQFFEHLRSMRSRGHAGLHRQ